nr:energy-coupling factor transporter transmembrane protein EcfT [Bacilli bacterium]
MLYFFLSFTVMFIFLFSLVFAYFSRQIGFDAWQKLIRYEEICSPLHRLDPRIKLLFPLIVTVSVIFEKGVFALLMVLFQSIIWSYLKKDQRRTLALGWFFLTQILVMTWIGTIIQYGIDHVFFASSYSIFHAILLGFILSFKISAITSSVLLLWLTTTPAEIIWSLTRFRIPSIFGLAIMIVLRFLPQLIEKIAVLPTVLKMRGMTDVFPTWQGWRSYPKMLRAWFWWIPVLFVTLTTRSVQATVQLAMIADAHAYGSRKTSERIYDHAVTATDRLVFFMMAVILIGVFATVFLIG